MRLVLIVVASVIAPIAALAALTPVRAEWAPCQTFAGTRCYADVYNGDGQQYHGAFLTEKNANMYLADYSQGQHINSEMWFNTNPSGTTYVEIGLRKGVDRDNCCGGEVPYEAFWDDTSGGAQYNHPIANYSPDGSTHYYEIQTDGASQYWDLYLDYNYAGYSSVAASPVGYYTVGGSEISLGPGVLDGGTHADTFDMYFENLSSTSYSWYSWPGEGGWTLDQGCDGYWVVPYCQNFVGYASNEWSWNKP